jgi:hypothetical protein
VDVTLTHPFPGLLKYTGFDVRGIFISQADKKFDTVGKEIAWGDAVPRLLNYDGYTNLFNPEKFAPSPKEPPMFRYIPGKKASGGNLTATLNPFVAYKKDAPRRMFEAGGSETKTVVIKAPKGPLHFGYAVDASWYPVQNVIDPVNDFPLSANCLEAYEISVSPESVPSGVNPDFVYVRVYDHQGTETIKSVTVSGPDFGDTEVDLALSADMGEYAVYSGPIEFNDTPGVYPLLVRVVDYEEDLNLGQIDAWQVYPWEVIPSKGWARTWGGNYYFYLNHYQEGRSVAVDNQENIYVAGA